MVSSATDSDALGSAPQLKSADWVQTDRGFSNGIVQFMPDPDGARRTAVVDGVRVTVRRADRERRATVP
ncbi:hypothetical protein MTY414_48130 [Mycolicibacterium mageritense]|nr:hypothetical protein MTY414_48130 [Mycolicibacterium mageritense]